MGMISVELFEPPKHQALDVPTLSQQEVKAGVLFRLTLNGASQERFFKRMLDPRHDALALQLADSGQERLLIGLRCVAISAPEALPLTSGVKGSLYLKLKPWTATAAKGKRPPERMVHAQSSSGRHLFRLPTWAFPQPAKPGAGKGLMDD